MRGELVVNVRTLIKGLVLRTSSH